MLLYGKFLIYDLCRYLLLHTLDLVSPLKMYDPPTWKGIPLNTTIEVLKNGCIIDLYECTTDHILFGRSPEAIFYWNIHPAQENMQFYNSIRKEKHSFMTKVLMVRFLTRKK